MPTIVMLHMARKLNTTTKEMVKAARAQIEEVDAAQAVAMSGNDNVVMVDLRDIRERQRSGFVPESFHCPRGMAEFWVDPQSPYYKEIFDQDAKFIFYCASGWRSALTVLTLQNMGFENAAHIKGGFTAWVEENGEVEKPE